MGNPASPALLQRGLFIPDTTWCQPRSSLLGDWVLSHSLNGTGVRKAHLSNTAAVGAVTWSIAERFDVSILLGEAQGHVKWVEKDQKFNSALVWGGAGKLILLEIKDTLLSAFGSAGGWNESHLKMRYWQVGAALTQHMKYVAPYIGVAVLRSRYTLENSAYFHQRRPVGSFLGCSFTNGTNFSFNAEYRAIFENGVSLSGEVRF